MIGNPAAGVEFALRSILHALLSMLVLIEAAIAQPNLALAEVALRVERLALAKRLWCGAAEEPLLPR
jgi:hypothetical protein